MADLKKTWRLHEMTELVQRGSQLSIDALMQRFGVTRRTVNRDLLDLDDLLEGKLRSNKLDDGHVVYYLPAAERRTRLEFAVRDLVALLLGRGLFDFVEGTSFEHSLGHVYEHCRAALKKERGVVGAEQLDRKLYIVSEGPKRLPASQAESVDDCLTALLREEKLDLLYRDSQDLESRLTVHPYTLVAFRRGLYLVGFSERHDAIRILGVERIMEAEVLRGQRFVFPADYSPKRFFSQALFLVPGAPEEVELLFSPTTERFIRLRQYHESQTLRVEADGRVRMNLCVPITFELVNFVLAFGAHVEVVRPTTLREDIRRELTKALAHYPD